MESSGGQLRIYHGLGSAEEIDYATPVAVAGEDDTYVSLLLAMAAGDRHFLGARAVSVAGIEEQNTHVVCWAEVDQAGSLLPPPLARPDNLTARALGNAVLAIGFSYYSAPPYVAAESFEVLSDGGTGQLDMDNPVAVAPARQSGEYNVQVSAEVLPARFAVRARVGEHLGPLSAVLFVPLDDPPAPRVMP